MKEKNHSQGFSYTKRSSSNLFIYASLSKFSFVSCLLQASRKTIFFIIIILRQPVFVLLKDTHQTLPVGTRPDLELPSSLAEK